MNEMDSVCNNRVISVTTFYYCYSDTMNNGGKYTWNISFLIEVTSRYYGLVYYVVVSPL